MQDFSKLRLFDERGYEVPLQYFYDFTFDLEIDNSKLAMLESKENVSCYILGDEWSCKQYDENDTHDLNNFWTGVIEKGSFILKNPEATKEELEQDVLDATTKLSFSLKIGDEVYTTEDKLNSAYHILNVEFNDPIVVKTGDYVDASYSILTIKSISFRDADRSGNAVNFKSEVIKKFVEDSIAKFNSNLAEGYENVATLFPYFKFYGAYNQEKVSADLVGATTFFLLDNPQDSSFCYPLSDTYDLKLYCDVNNNDELRLITNTMSEDNIIWKHDENKSLDKNVVSNELTYDVDDWSNPVPLTFTIGFLSDTEGVYKNNLEFYLVNREQNEVYSLGFLIVNSTVVGEDERYRTLFTNFGIPDPITYAEVFKETDPLEEGIDFQLVNRKSKELYLTYDQIFPYVGTYKALINAVKFLGYDDIYFKEYYKLLDPARGSRMVSYQSVDMTTGETMQAKLAKIGLSLEDFLKYKKLNQISMIYHLNEEYEDSETVEYSYKVGNEYKTAKKTVEIPSTINVYEYQTSEVLAKLFSLKQWLEKYIIPVNAYIKDVTGEGIYFYRYKNQAYTTQYNTIDYKFEAPLTPVVKNKNQENQLKDSSALVSCSLAEFNSLKLKDYQRTPIRNFISKIVDVSKGLTDSHSECISNYAPDLHVIDDWFPVSNPLKAALTINDWSVNLNLETSTGSLLEYAKDKKNPIVLRENEICNFNPQALDSMIDSSVLPTIVLKSGNIRRTFGNWQNNIIWTIKKVTDVETGHFTYQMKKVKGEDKDFNGLVLDERGIILIPKDSSSSFTYTERTKYDAPQIVITDYKLSHSLIGNQKNIFDISGDYILEILEGELQFKDIRISNQDSSDYTANEALSTKVVFSIEQDVENISIEGKQTKFWLPEQQITPSYTYKSKRYPVYEYHVDSAGKKEEIAKHYHDLNEEKRKVIDTLTDESGSRRITLKKKLLRDYTKEFDLLKYSGASALDYSLISDEELDSRILRMLGVNSYTRITSKNIYTLFKNVLDNSKYKDDVAEQDTISGLFNSSVKFASDLINYRYEDQSILYVSSKYEKDLHDLISKYLNDYDASLYSSWNAYMKNSSLYKVNDTISMKVNHIGDYTLTGYGYDGYNNIYVNQSKQLANVYSVAPKINIYLNQENSDNDFKYFAGNKNGTLVSDASSLLDYVDSNIELPKVYNISSLFLSKDSNNLSYYNTTYALDTPKKNDYFYLDNLTEQATSVISLDETNKEIVVSMLDENPEKQELYIKGLHVNLVVYDNIRKAATKVFENLLVTNYTKVQDSSDNNFYDDNQLVLFNISESDVFDYCHNVGINAGLQSGKTKLYVTSAEEFKLDEEQVVNNYETKTCQVFFKLSDGKAAFREGDVVKVMSKTSFLPQQFSTVFNEYDGGASYRILNVSKDESFQYYTLNGLIDPFRWQWSKEVVMSYANTLPVQYMVRVNDDAEEVSYPNQLNDTLDFTTSFPFDASSWLGREYIDGTYSGFNLDFNVDDAVNAWVPKDEFYGLDLYKFQEFPATVESGRLFIVDSEDTENTYESYKSSWRWMTDTVEDLENWPSDVNSHDNYTTTLFRSINNVLSLNATMKGRQDVELETVDLYGNRLTNRRVGVLFVK